MIQKKKSMCDPKAKQKDLWKIVMAVIHNSQRAFKPEVHTHCYQPKADSQSRNQNAVRNHPGGK